MRKFEKISFEEFKKEINDECLYEKYDLPKRKTKASAGYDIASMVTKTLKPGESFAFPTGIKCALNEDDVLFIIIRSSLGFKHNLRLVNQVGVIDADYYNNPDNEGHIFIKLQNEGDKEITINALDRIAQGIIMKYECVDEEEEITETRKGGFGSTGGK